VSPGAWAMTAGETRTPNNPKAAMKVRIRGQDTKTGAPRKQSLVDAGPSPWPLMSPLERPREIDQLREEDSDAQRDVISSGCLGTKGGPDARREYRT